MRNLRFEFLAPANNKLDQRWDEWVGMIDRGELRLNETEWSALNASGQLLLAGDISHLLHQPYLTTLLAYTLHPSTNSHCSSRYPTTPSPNSTLLSTNPRYTHLANSSNHYYIALNLHNSAHLAPGIFTQLLRLMHHLGPQNVFISIFESASTDRTGELLHLFDAILTIFSVPHNITMGTSPPRESTNRIVRLAEIRNNALATLYAETNKQKWSHVLFINDIVFCAEDALELIHQGVGQDADITCGLDYQWPWYLRQQGLPPVFYDMWVSRNIEGAPFQPTSNTSLIPNDPLSLPRINHTLPFQAQCCWNGITLLRSTPFTLPTQNATHFRAGTDTETDCPASECSLLCNDFQNAGYARVLVVPGVRVAYGMEEYEALVENEGAQGVRVVQFNKEVGDEERESVTWRDPSDVVWCQGCVGNQSQMGEWRQISVPVGKRPGGFG
ncbi:capsular associated protein [Rhizophlyctis rosea]|nr:capsular associated protein [Rhizophlyctis rosea]